MTIARHFSGGWAGEVMRVPSARLKWTLDADGRHFSRPYGTGMGLPPRPGVETPGYLQESLPDSHDV
jgi:hypothetical protein